MSKFVIYCDNHNNERADVNAATVGAAAGAEAPLGKQRKVRTPLRPRQAQPLRQQTIKAALAAAASTANTTAAAASNASAATHAGQHPLVPAAGDQLRFRRGQPLAASNPSNYDSSALENRENDLTLESIGSDLISSSHDNHSHLNNSSLSFSTEDACEEDGDFGGGSQLEQSFLAEEDFTFATDDTSDDYECDAELQMELDEAFEEHDSRTIFKCIDYVADIRDYLKQLERTPEIRAHPNYMSAQDELDSTKRRTLVDWLVDVADEFRLQTETYFITINIIDRFLSHMAVPLSNFQLLGVAAMLIACKYEEIHPPDLYQFVDITDESYSCRQIRLMELQILAALDFRLSVPTSVFFVHEILTFNKLPKQVLHMAEYLCYLAMLEDKPFLEYYPSEIACAAVILAANECNAASNISPELKQAFDRTNVDQLERIDKNPALPLCVQSLLHIQTSVTELSSTYKRFSSEQFESVALIEPNIDLTSIVSGQ